MNVETQRLEARVLAIAEAALAGRQVEDDRVELKATWPAADQKTARQIAGHANASGGEPILWIVGLDEKSQTFGSTSGEEPADWWGAITKHFAEVEPSLEILRVPIAPGQDVVALQFTTDRAPYVVSVEGGGRVSREVPWRAGNATRTAHRHELIRALVAEASVPHLELVGGLVDIDEFVHDPHTGEYQHAAIGDIRVRCALNMFVSSAGPAYLPEHRQTLTLTSSTTELTLAPFRFTGSYRFDGLTQSGIQRRVPAGNVSVFGSSGLEVTGSGDLKLRGESVFNAKDADALMQSDTVNLDLRLPVDRSERSARLTCELSEVQLGVGDIPDHNDSWHTQARFVVGAKASWWQ